MQPAPQEPVVRVIAMPADTNPYGDIFGGWLMSQMDLPAGNAAARHSAGRAVTIAVEGMMKVTEAAFTFVAIGPDRRPRSVTPLRSA